ncbi:MAG TPA: CoA-binding protein [Blastocatellia bacterium]|nr:CoA-binding protein [Blastocatellia bacterium]
MSNLEAKVSDFLAQKRIAIAGVSRTKPGAASLIYRKLKDSGYQVFAVNPNASTYEGDPCYPDLKSIPGGVDGAVLVTRPELTDELVRQCAEAGVSRVWMHQSLGKAGTSVSQQAIQFCDEHSITVIAGACPMMFCGPVDFGHKCMRWILRFTGGLPN